MKGSISRKINFNRIVNIVIFISLSIGFVGIGFFSYCKSQDINIKDFTINDIFKRNTVESMILFEDKSMGINFDPLMGTQFEVMQSYVIQSTKNMIRFLNKKGQQLTFYPIIMNNPEIRVAGEYSVVADIKGKNISVFYRTSKLWDTEMERKIINIDINSIGNLVVVSEASRHTSEVTVFDKRGNFVLKLGKAEHYVLNTKFTKNNDKFVLNMLKTSGVTISSMLEFVQLSGKMDKRSYQKKDIIFSNINFLKNDEIFVVGDSKIFLLDKEKREKWKMNIKGEIFTSSICLDSYPIIAVSKEEKEGRYNINKSDVNIYNIKGEEIVDFQVSEKVKHIECYKEKIGIVTESKIYFITYVGEVLGHYVGEQEITDIKFINGSQVLIVGKDYAEILNIKE